MKISLKNTSHIKFMILNGGLQVDCQYCSKTAKYVDSAYVYGKSYGMIYYCEDCQAWVGVHKGTNKPLGVLANGELREHKQQAHAYFDALWKSGKMKRGNAYNWLARKLGKAVEDTHIGMFSIADCKRTVTLVREYLKREVKNNERAVTQRSRVHNCASDSSHDRGNGDASS